MRPSPAPSTRSASRPCERPRARLGRIPTANASSGPSVESVWTHVVDRDAADEPVARACRRVTGCFGSPCDASGGTGARRWFLFVQRRSWAGIARGSAGDGPDAQRLARTAVRPSRGRSAALVREMAGHREFVVGSAPDPRRAADAWPRGVRTYRVASADRADTAAIADVADLPDESPRVRREAWTSTHQPEAFRRD